MSITRTAICPCGRMLEGEAEDISLSAESVDFLDEAGNIVRSVPVSKMTSLSVNVTCECGLETPVTLWERRDSTA